MSRESAILSVAELERLLRDRKSKLNDLVRRRTKLQRELEQIERQILELEGKSDSSVIRAAKRPRNEKTLAEVVNEVLNRNKSGLTLSALAERVFATGYRSSSTNFNNVLYQCLYNAEEIVHDPETGKYSLK